MGWLHFLSYVSYAVTVIADMIGLYVIWPAYKRTRHRAFLLLSAAFALGIFDTICDHTIGLMHMSFWEYLPYRTLRRLAYFADVILGLMGVILLTRSYLSSIGKTDEGKPPVV